MKRLLTMIVPCMPATITGTGICSCGNGIMPRLI
jgi:hypothetical protein